MICFPHHFFYFRIFADDSIITFFSMRYHTLTAVLAAILQIPVVAATIAAQHIEWAIAKEAIKGFWVRCLMTGKVFACFMRKKAVVLFFHTIISYKMLSETSKRLWQSYDCHSRFSAH